MDSIPQHTVAESATITAEATANPVGNISILSAASQQLKTETENALLREALAMSAQNCEALMKQLVESQTEFQHKVMSAIELSQKAYMGVHHDLKTGLEKAYSLIEKIAVLRDKIAECQKDWNDTDVWLRAIRKYEDMEMLTADILLELIDRIEVFESEGQGRKKVCKIRVNYRFVGHIGDAVLKMKEAEEADSYEAV